MKTVTLNDRESAQLLLDSGLLGELNRLVLHPRGLALAVQVDPHDHGRALGFSGMVDYRDSPPGIWLNDEMNQEITAKVAAYDAAHPPKNPENK
jgi:hypothetical protein